jgi:hypothetical protein
MVGLWSDYGQIMLLGVVGGDWLGPADPVQNMSSCIKRINVALALIRPPPSPYSVRKGLEVNQGHPSSSAIV